MRTALIEHRLASQHTDGDDLVFYAWGKRGLDYATVRRVFQRALTKAGIDYSGRRCSLHGLRHSFASRLVRSGTDIVAVSRLLGHAKVSMTLDTYSHYLPTQGDGDALRDSVERGLARIERWCLVKSPCIVCDGRPEARCPVLPYPTTPRTRGGKHIRENTNEVSSAEETLIAAKAISEALDAANMVVPCEALALEQGVHLDDYFTGRTPSQASTKFNLTTARGFFLVRVAVDTDVERRRSFRTATACTGGRG